MNEDFAVEQLEREPLKQPHLARYRRVAGYKAARHSIADARSVGGIRAKKIRLIRRKETNDASERRVATKRSQRRRRHTRRERRIRRIRKAVLVGGTWLVAYLSARHFLSSFEERHTALLAHSWAFFSAALAYILGHWLLFYGLVAQIIVILTVVGYCLAALYYLESNDRLTTRLRRQLVGIMIMILVLVVALSDWTGTTI